MYRYEYNLMLYVALDLEIFLVKKNWYIVFVVLITSCVSEYGGKLLEITCNYSEDYSKLLVIT